MSLTSVILLLAIITATLMAGLLFSFYCSVNPGLGRLSDSEYVAAMKSINKAILNPLFFVVFLGPLLLLPITTFLHYVQPVSVRFVLLLIATLVYACGVFGTTIFGNVPLNEALAAFNLSSATSGEIGHQRIMFEGPWNRLHNIRTTASLVSAILAVLSCILKENTR